MTNVEILQFTYIIANIPYSPSLAKTFFSEETYNQRITLRQNPPSQDFTVRALAPLFAKSTLIASSDERTYPYCVYLLIGETLFVLVRGTVDPLLREGWLKGLKKLENPLGGDWQVNGHSLIDKDTKFHSGFLGNAKRGLNALEEAIKNKTNKLAGNYNRVVFSGHSMGAATASIMSYLYKKAHPAMDVESLVLSCPKFIWNDENTMREYIETIPNCLHLYSFGDVTPTMSIGTCTHPFKFSRVIQLCLPVAIDIAELEGDEEYDNKFSVLEYIGNCLHSNFYKDMHLIGDYKSYRYVVALCHELKSNPRRVGAVEPDFKPMENNGKLLQEDECKAIQSQLKEIKKYYNKTELLKSIVDNVVLRLGISLGQSVASTIAGTFSGIFKFFREGKRSPKTGGGDDKSMRIELVGSILTLAMESLVIAQAHKIDAEAKIKPDLQSDLAGILATQYLLNWHSLPDSPAHSPDEVPSEAPMSPPVKAQVRRRRERSPKVSMHSSHSRQPKKSKKQTAYE
jgi:hypothetical protein